MAEYDFDDDVSTEEEVYTERAESASAKREAMLSSRRRIEDLKELRRIRELLEDDEFVVDFE